MCVLSVTMLILPYIYLNMTNFEVSLNGEKICLAGIPAQYSVLAVHTIRVRRRGEEIETLDLNVSGLNSETSEQYRWQTRDLRINDEIRIKIVDSDFPDQPDEIIPQESKDDSLKRKIEYFYRLKEELKDHIQD